ncbi:MAG: AAA family ATPase [Candidatus Heimdallarchaeota archaeon]
MQKNGWLTMMSGLLNFPELEELILGEKFDPKIIKSKVVHIYGEAGSGKTTVAVQLAVGYSLKNKKVIYIDTEGKVSGEKIKNIVSEENFDKVNKNIKIYFPRDFEKQHDLIQKLEFYLSNQNIGAIIIDTMTNLYRQAMLFKKDTKILYEKLAYEVAFLRKLSRDRNITIILVNQATMPKAIKNEDDSLSYNYERINPAAKAIMSYWADREIILVSHGWGNFEARIPGEFERRVKFGINDEGIAPQ